MSVKSIKCFLCGLIGFIPVLVKGQNAATVKEYQKEFVTYPFSQPNPVANPTKIYPYFRFDGFTNQPVNRKWKVVELENDFIKVQIMPQIGGKIWTAIDKKSNRPFIYQNDVVKFRDIALRGPWTSGGIEANFGIFGHTPGVSAPVDYLTKINDDGSVACIISLLDQLTQTRWSMEIRLPKDKAYFTTTAFWHNGTEIDQPYYTWMNLAEKASDDLELIEPGNHHLFHDGKSYNWSYDSVQKRNLAFYKQIDFGLSQSFHITGLYSKYWGAFYQKDNYGMIRFAERSDKIGKKVFVWGQSRNGMIWDKLLNDNAGQYVELQSGRLYIQNNPQSVYSPYKQISLTPYQTDTWKEYWYPFKNTNGVAVADTTGVLNLKQDAQSATVYFSSVSYLKDTLKVTDQTGKIILNKRIELEPLQNIAQTIHLSSGQRIMHITLGETEMSIKDSVEKVLSRPVKPLSKVDYASAYGLYLKGEYFAGIHYYAEAEANIKASLDKEPNFIPALTEMALLQYNKMNYQGAFDHARKALSIDTYDGKANYYYSLAALKLNKLYDAEDGFELAALTTEYRNAAYTELCKIKVSQQHFTEAGSYANKSLEYNNQNITALQLQYLTARLTNNQKLAETVKNRILALDPLNHFIRFETYWKKKDEKTLADFTGLIRDELPEQTYLDLAAWYYDLNLEKESEAILEIAPKNSELLYWLAYLHRNDKDAVKYLDQAKNSSALLIFPYKAESVTVMQWAIQQSKTDWKPRYYLSLLYESVHDRIKARQQIEHIDTAINFAPFYAFRARLRDSTNKQQQLSDLTVAAKTDAKDWRYVRYLADFLVAQKQNKQALGIVSPYYQSHLDNYIIGMIYARCLMLSDQYDLAEKVLGDLKVLPYEGARDGHKLYEQTKLVPALQLVKQKNWKAALQKVDEARLWPENLGVGAPYADLIDSSLENNIEKLIKNGMKNNPPSEKVVAAYMAKAKAINGI